MKKLSTLQFSDFTEQEFTDFVTKIREADYRTEAQHDDAIYQFARITQHPDGWNLIYYPQPGQTIPRPALLRPSGSGGQKTANHISGLNDRELSPGRLVNVSNNRRACY